MGALLKETFLTSGWAKELAVATIKNNDIKSSFLIGIDLLVTVFLKDTWMFQFLCQNELVKL